jgi:hypothetical protein
MNSRATFFASAGSLTVGGTLETSLAGLSESGVSSDVPVLPTNATRNAMIPATSTTIEVQKMRAWNRGERRRARNDVACGWALMTASE